MKLAIMQPYLFPYLGYFQLINMVDKFVLYDDVNYIKQGWINRNRILLNEKAFIITLQLFGASSFKLINQIEVGNNQKKFLKTIIQAYQKALNFQSIFPIIEKVLFNDEKNLAKVVRESIYQINDYLGIKTDFIISSELTKDNNLKGQEKVLSLCKILDAVEYINPIGGSKLYNNDAFSQAGIKLSFHNISDVRYKQFKNEFIPNLSIIDVLMFNSKAEIQSTLNMYELIQL